MKNGLSSNAAKLSKETFHSFFLGVGERARTVSAGDRVWYREIGRVLTPVDDPHSERPESGNNG